MTPDPLVLDVGSAVEALAGEPVSGDFAHVERLEDGRALLVLADGLGHGPAAAEPARAAVAALARAATVGLGPAFREAHRALRGTRGAVAAAVLVDGASRKLQAAILGNIVVRRVGTRGGHVQSTSAVAVPGVLGSAFRDVLVQDFDIAEGDIVAVYSDGVRSHFDTLQLRAIDARSAAAEIVAQHGRGHDDASSIVVRVLPSSAVVQPSALAPSRDAGRRVPLSRMDDIQVAATAARGFAGELGLPGRAQWEIGIAAAELAQNVLKYGVEGQLVLRSEGAGCVVLEAVDRGPGFGAAEPRPGLREGLGAVRRMMDTCEVHSSPIGTRVVARKRVG
jgi:negative regulator of sigma-B (phosphoserine phosphatase)